MIDYKNLFLAIFLSIAIFFGWHYFVEIPQLKNAKVNNTNTFVADKPVLLLSKEEAIKKDKRIKISTPSLEGSISLNGLRFDELILTKYKQDLSPNSSNVELLYPDETKESYFLGFGWYSPVNITELPSNNTVWQCNKTVLTNDNDGAEFSWTNSDKVKFTVQVTVDENYMFNIKQTVFNPTTKQLNLHQYYYINKNGGPSSSNSNMVHEGLIGSIEGNLKELSESKIKDEMKNSQGFFHDFSHIDWLGLTDKYWLTAFIPDHKLKYNSKFSVSNSGPIEVYMLNAMSTPLTLAPNSSISLEGKLFLGAKEVKLLDHYSNKFNIKLFDRAIDFGWFYILTKPMFNALNFFNSIVQNFGFSILIVTVLIKLIMFSFANQSYTSMEKMRSLQPQIERIKELYGNDRIRLNQEIMDLYKKEKVNPVSGCLPLLIQIPVFFSLYKVLSVTIEMRHAEFLGWIQDLSAPDPTSILNLFGLVPITLPAFLNIGVWPALMSFTMYLQQRLNPPAADPVQDQVMKLMPLMFLIMFSRFPAGLVIYWTWNNVLSILQQLYINHKHSKRKVA